MGGGIARRATLRNEKGIVESVVCDDDMTFKEAEKGLIDAAEIAGLEKTDKNIRITGNAVRRPAGKRSVSYPGRATR